jgi:hypothetical protein
MEPSQFLEMRSSRAAVQRRRWGCESGPDHSSCLRNGSGTIAVSDVQVMESVLPNCWHRGRQWLFTYEVIGGTGLGPNYQGHLNALSEHGEAKQPGSHSVRDATSRAIVRSVMMITIIAILPLVSLQPHFMRLVFTIRVSVKPCSYRTETLPRGIEKGASNPMCF